MMDCEIFWFSGTGNSLKLAKDVSAAMNGRLISMAQDARKPELHTKSEIIGFVLPTYYLGIPKIVAEFIQKLDAEKSAYIFVLATRGWPVVGGVIHQMKTLLKAKGLKLSYGAYVTMPGNDFTFAKVANEKEQQRLFDRYPEHLSKIIGELRERKQHYDLEPTALLLPIRRKVYLKNSSIASQAFTVADNCNSCGTCTRVCSVGNIRLKAKHPEWDDSCQLCFACFHYCPKKAILYNGIGEDILHYHHPEIPAGKLHS